MKTLFKTIVIATVAMSSQAFSQDLSVKTNAYIKCYNGISGRAIDSINRYESWVKDMKKGPTGKERIVYGLYTLHDHVIKDCKENIPVAVAVEPKQEELDQAADNYLKATLTLNEKINEANRYYDRENYKDDNFAKGKEMHKPLSVAMENFLKAHDELSKQLEEVNNNAMKAQLVEIEKNDGKKFNYWMLSTMIEAKPAVNLLSKEQFDVEKAKSLISAYENSADKLIEQIKSDTSVEMARYATLPMTIDNYRKALKERMRRVRDKKPYSTGEKMQLNPSSGWMVNGSPYKVMDTYNKLIEAVNR
ncbi:YiiG family protein [Pasteurella atlantica]|uniref:YiiG family protein n=1 Tax=Pasteurellaceae TaxID=712 RepID=UPI0027464F7F|nr:YiiG family protein [Pasteurella atlantica]MDP8099206.1 YiiG family protein [Pasteurella atlantica]MDP8107232.1 YiiG family protein [Pasteurella atlantica]MDP8116923.1 YiiG family protein [Pasteurella atlantica]